MTSFEPADPDMIPDSRIIPLERIPEVRAFVDIAITTEDRKRVVIGWIFDPASHVRGLSLLIAEAAPDLAPPVKSKRGASSKRPARNHVRLPIEHGVEGMQLVRVARPDVSMAMSGITRSATDMHGFIAVLPLAPDEAELAIETSDGRFALLQHVAVTDAASMVKGLKQLTGVSHQMILSTLRAGIGDDHPLYALVRDLPGDLPTGALSPARSAKGGRKLQSRLGTTLADFTNLPLFTEKPDLLIGCVDRGYPLGETGVLLYGWFFTPKIEPLSISVHDDAGNSVEVGHRIVNLYRLDVVNAYRQRFPNVDGMSGYAVLAPVPTKGGEPRALCFDFGDAGEVWLKIPCEKPGTSGVMLAKEILAMVNDPAQVRTRLFDIFDKVLGDAVETVSSARRPVSDEIDTVQFGTAPEAPETSLIVPLYGRFDFLRHQLAHFADDEEFRGKADLIYVIDDPSIVAQTLELASRYHQLFRVPFRVVWHGENRGYAGADNVGARFARGRHLVLLNSDVIPQQAGWLSTLSRALDSLPEAGAVGPLLQFGDGSIQHAGMYPRTDVSWPGFILNTHRHMGMAWTGGNTPAEHPMLTAACLMMRTADFNAVGGFDENYLIGDFEDSDLCLSLRKRGLRLYLVPEARLWHLERQSQNLEGQASQRQMVTLFNGWRYTRKIRNGQLVDPLKLDVRYMKVVILSHGHPTFSKGGGEYAAYYLWQGLNRRPDTKAWFIGRAHPEALHQFCSLAVMGERDYIMSGNAIIADLTATTPLGEDSDFAELLRSIDPDVVHLHHYVHLGIELIRVIRNVCPRARIVVTLHEFIAICMNNGQMVKTDGRLCHQYSPRECNLCFRHLKPEDFFLREHYIKSFFRLVDGFISPSHFLRRRYEDWGLVNDHFAVIENGQPEGSKVPPRSLADGETRSRFAYFGQVNPYKGIDVILEAVANLPKALRKQISLDIYGTGLENQTEDFQKKIAGLLEICGKSVHLHGGYEPEELGRLMREVDWVVMGSVWWENSPLVIQEAYKFGRPVICPDIGGMAEKVPDGIGGLNYRARDAVSLANLMKRVLAEPGLFDGLCQTLPPYPAIGAITEDHVAYYQSLRTGEPA